MFNEELKQDKVTCIPFFKGKLQSDFNKLELFLDSLHQQKLKASHWTDLKIIPKASFVMCYTPDSVCLKYDISEPYFKADYRHTNDPVSEDSCVELFISFGEDVNYYNLEFNALGTCLAAYGSGRNDRQRLPEELIAGIQHVQAWKVYIPEHNNYQWTLTLNIPLQVFCYSNLSSLDGSTARANVYKCGDQLIEPHYLMWNDIKTDQPDYHQPEYFRKISFEQLQDKNQ